MNRINRWSQKEKEESVLRRGVEGEGELSYAAVVGSISLKAPEASSNPGKRAGKRTCLRRSTSRHPGQTRVHVLDT